MATELAKAYIQLVPSAQGIKGSIAKVMDGEAESAGKSAGGKFASMFGSTLKVGAAGVAAAGAALVKVGKDAIAEFADYEQLIGGVETLFKENADAVAENAARAFQTAGLSANEYMETVTGFSASLLQSLGGDTEAAAKIGDMAIRDMADNANKMGSSMESIQNAYQGFAKQNYTMLDNLKLGYGGTKHEMERLLVDATALSGVEYDISSLSDVYEAIHVIQDELGITGTTAKEASSTISGSLAAMKASWHNLLVGAADDTADISALVDDFVTSAVTAGENIIPRVEAILGGLGDMLTQAADRLVPLVVTAIGDNLPAIVEGGVQMVATLVAGIVGAIPELVAAVSGIIKTIVDGLITGWAAIKSAGGELVTLIAESVLTGLPNLANAAATTMQSFGGYLQEHLPTIIETGLQTIKELTATIRENAGIIIDGAIGLALSLAQGLIDSIPAIIENVPEIVSNIANVINDNAPKVLAAGWELIKMLVRGLIESIPVIIQNLPKIISAIWDTITAVKWLNLGGKIIDFMSQGIKGMLGTVLSAAKDIVKSITEGGGLIKLPQMAKQWGRDLIDNFVGGIKAKFSALKDAVTGAANLVKRFIGFSEPEEGPLSDFHTYAPDMMDLFSRGIRDNLNTVRTAAQDAAQATRDGWASNTPSRKANAPESTKNGSDTAALVSALREALSGMGVYMDGDRVGRLVTRRQSNTARAYG